MRLVLDTRRGDAPERRGGGAPPPPTSLPAEGSDDIAGTEVLRRVAAEPRHAPEGRPWLVLNMVASVDGASAGVEGRSGSLSGSADREVFHALRAVADVILAGAGTVRAENYGPPKLADGAGELRAALGLRPLPRMAVVTGRLRLDPGARFFQEAPAEARPIVLTTTEAVSDLPEHAAALSELADVVPVGGAALDWPAALRRLHDDYGARLVLAEGGPTINAHLLEHGLVDELCLTVSPLILGGATQRIVAAVPPLDPVPLRLDRVFEDEGFLLLRYVRQP